MKTYLSFKFRPLAHISCKFSQFSGHLPQLPVILPILSFSCRADIVTTWVTEGTMLSNQVSHNVALSTCHAQTLVNVSKALELI